MKLSNNLKQDRWNISNPPPPLPPPLQVKDKNIGRFGLWAVLSLI